MGAFVNAMQQCRVEASSGHVSGGNPTTEGDRGVCVRESMYGSLGPRGRGLGPEFLRPLSAGGGGSDGKGIHAETPDEASEKRYAKVGNAIQNAWMPSGMPSGVVVVGEHKRMVVAMLQGSHQRRYNPVQSLVQKTAPLT